MIQEIKIFKDAIMAQNAFFNTKGYFFSEEVIYNETDFNATFYKYKLNNQSLNKSLTYVYYPSVRAMTKNEIEVFFTNSNLASIDIPSFLAYKKLQKPISQKDKDIFRFKIRTNNFDFEIRIQLEAIKEILSQQLQLLFTTPYWLNIPILDLKDEY